MVSRLPDTTSTSVAVDTSTLSSEEGSCISTGDEADASRLMDSAAAAAGISDHTILVGIDDSSEQYLLHHQPDTPPQPPTPVFEDTKLKPRHPCSVCRQCFALRSTWYEHMRQAHSITKPFACDECPKRYSMLGALNYHRLTTHRGVVHACKTCGKRFMTKPGLVRHAKSHFGGVYLCEDCSKTFPTRDSLRRHRQQVHMGEKPHVCQYCQEKFGASHSLKRHIKRRHSTRSSSATASAAAHQLVAEGHSPAAPAATHVCSVCHRGFLSAEALRKHVQSMHQHARYQCETCLRRFSDWSNLNRHKRSTKSCMPVLRVDSTVSTMADEGVQHSDVITTVGGAPTTTTPIVIQHLALQPSTQLQVHLSTASGAEEGSVLLTGTSSPPAEHRLPSLTHQLTCVGSKVELTGSEFESHSFLQLQSSSEDPAASATLLSAAECSQTDSGLLVPAGPEPAGALLAPDSSSACPTTVVSSLDHVELQPVNAVELQALEAPGELQALESAGELQALESAGELHALEAGEVGAAGLEQAVLVPVTLAPPGVGGAQQDVFVTLYPAGGDGSGHRFICVQSDGGAVLTELPLALSEQLMDVN